MLQQAKDWIEANPLQFNPDYWGTIYATHDGYEIVHLCWAGVIVHLGEPDYFRSLTQGWGIGEDVMLDIDIFEIAQRLAGLTYQQAHQLFFEGILPCDGQ